jgi:regulator of RNase E activity RraA
MLPYRPDFHDVVQKQGEAEGRIGGQNSWVIDTLLPNDVMVVDLYGKIREGTFVGDNLSTAVKKRTRAGAVIDGGIRDYDGIRELTDVAFFCRGVDPTPIRNTTLGGINIPIRIGHTTVLPGDIVLGTPTGVTFIPPHLVKEIVETGENVHLRDRFGKQRLGEGKYTPGEIDVGVWAEHIQKDYEDGESPIIASNQLTLCARFSRNPCPPDRLLPGDIRPHSSRRARRKGEQDSLEIGRFIEGEKETCTSGKLYESFIR